MGCQHNRFVVSIFTLKIRGTRMGLGHPLENILPYVAYVHLALSFFTIWRIWHSNSVRLQQVLIACKNTISLYIYNSLFYRYVFLWQTGPRMNNTFIVDFLNAKQNNSKKMIIVLIGLIPFSWYVKIVCIDRVPSFFN